MGAAPLQGACLSEPEGNEPPAPTRNCREATRTQPQTPPPTPNPTPTLILAPHRSPLQVESSEVESLRASASPSFESVTQASTYRTAAAAAERAEREEGLSSKCAFKLADTRRQAAELTDELDALEAAIRAKVDALERRQQREDGGTGGDEMRAAFEVAMVRAEDA
jgi:hypothetical protein